MDKTSKNKNLSNAKTAKNDEFYTQLSDIENELKHYREHFKDKVVYCNCDDAEKSKFWVYFSKNFKFLGLKKLISTHYAKDGEKAYNLQIFEDVNDDGTVNHLDTIKIQLNGNGDFRSEECLKILQESDIVVTNPPFSLFREFVDLLVKFDKKFLIIGNKNAITYKETFSLIKQNKIWLGITYPKTFIKPDKTTQTFGNITWFTNLTHKKRNEEFYLYKTYYGNENLYPKYDNYDAINIDKVSDIPMDYKGVMGVPITFLDKWNPKQFEILGLIDGKYRVINGNNIYQRLEIKKI